MPSYELPIGLLKYLNLKCMYIDHILQSPSVTLNDANCGMVWMFFSSIPDSNLCSFNHLGRRIFTAFATMISIFSRHTNWPMLIEKPHVSCTTWNESSSDSSFCMACGSNARSAHTERSRSSRRTGNELLPITRCSFSKKKKDALWERCCMTAIDAEEKTAPREAASLLS